MSFFYGFDCLVACFSFKGQLSTQHGIEDYTNSPNIDFTIESVVLLVTEALRSHVAETTCIHLLYSHGTDRTSYAEIDNFDFLLL